MPGDGTRSAVGVGAVVAGLGAVASGAGVFLRGDLSTIPFTTVRGELVDTLTDGVYRFNGLQVAAEGVGWDAVTLTLVVPALVLTLVAVWRGSLRAELLATGLLAYFVYQYGEYATYLAYGPLFPVYVAIVALSLCGIGLLVGSLEIARLPDRFGPGFPRRAVIGFGLFMAILLTAMWLPLIAQTFDETTVATLGGGTTLVVQAFDLGVLVPLGLLTAIALRRRLAVGYLLAAVVVVKGMAMGTAIAAMLVVEASATGVVQAVPIVGFALIAVVSLAIASRVFGSVRPETKRASVEELAQVVGGAGLVEAAEAPRVLDRSNERVVRMRGR